MESVFLKVFNLAVASTWLAAAVILVRFLLKKAPRRVIFVLWALLALRLALPVSFESPLSLVPSAETVPETVLYEQTPHIQSGISAVNSVVNPVIAESLSPAPGASVNPMRVVTFAAGAVWLLGVAVMLFYMAVSYLVMRRRVREAVPAGEDRVFVCDRVPTPFILGVFRPRIYVPSSCDGADLPYILAHERAHLSRGDHFIKPLAFLFLAVYWFHPLFWAAYFLFCRDVETACDEKVLGALGEAAKKPYSEALINCAAPRRTVGACPLAFGEVGTKARVKNVLSFRRPTVWIILAALALAAAAAVFFFTSPKKPDLLPDTERQPYTFSGDENVALEIADYNFACESPYVRVRWTNCGTEAFSVKKSFAAWREADGEKTLCCENKSDETFVIAPGESKTLLYGLSEAGDLSSGSLRLRLSDTERDTYVVTIASPWADIRIERIYARVTENPVEYGEAIILNKDGTFFYNPPYFSSRIYPPGTYRCAGDELILTFSDGSEARLVKEGDDYVCVSDEREARVPIRKGTVWRDPSLFLSRPPRLVLGNDVAFVGAERFNWFGERVTLSGDGQGRESVVMPAAVTGRQMMELLFSSYDPDDPLSTPFLYAPPTSVIVTAKDGEQTREIFRSTDRGGPYRFELPDGKWDLEVEAIWSGAGTAFYSFSAEWVAPAGTPRVLFYPSACDEGTELIKGTVLRRALSGTEEKNLASIVAGKPVTDDYICDREPFRGFSGCFELRDGKLYIFSLSQKIVYYDHYFFKLSDAEADYIRALK